MNRRILCLLILALLPPVVTADDRGETYTAHAADYGTTAIGLTLGAAEMNPLAIPGIPLSLYLTEREKGKCSITLAQFRAVRYGAAANNGAVIAGILAGVSTFPFSLVLVPVVAVPVYRHEAEQVLDCKVAVAMCVLKNPENSSDCLQSI